MPKSARRPRCLLDFRPPSQATWTVHLTNHVEALVQSDGDGPTSAIEGMTEEEVLRAESQVPYWLDDYNE